MIYSPGDWVVRAGHRTAESDPADGGQVVDRVLERRPGHPEHGRTVAVVVSWGSFSCVEPIGALALQPAQERALICCPYCGTRRGLESSGQWRCPRCGSATPLPEHRWNPQAVAHTGQGTCDHCHADALCLAEGEAGWTQMYCRRCRARGPREGSRAIAGGLS
jgi:hypothetical protein